MATSYFFASLLLHDAPNTLIDRGGVVGSQISGARSCVVVRVDLPFQTEHLVQGDVLVWIEIVDFGGDLNKKYDFKYPKLKTRPFHQCEDLFWF